MATPLRGWIRDFASPGVALPGLLLLSAFVTPPPAATATRADLIDGACREAEVQHLIGRLLTAELQATARSRSGASTVRVIRPGDPVTMDHLTDRLNLDVDGSNRMVRIHCG